MDNPQTYDIDNIEGGFNSHTKISGIYTELREEVIPEEPVQWLEDPMIELVLPNNRGEGYVWELYRVGDSSVMVELFGGISGYGNPKDMPPRVETAKTPFRHMKIAVHEPTSELTDKIEEIIARHPRESRKSLVSISQPVDQ